MSVINQKLLKKLGINVPNYSRVMAYDQNSGGLDSDGRFLRFKLNYSYNKSRPVAMDSALSTSPNVGVPLPNLTLFNPNIIPVLFSQDATAELLPNHVSGSFGTLYQTFTISETVGASQGYSDLTTAPTADVNFNYLNREQYRFESSIIYGDLEVETASLGQINLIAQKQEALARTIAKDHERINLFGVKGMSLYGFLNCPDYPNEKNALTVTITGNKQTFKWDEKATDKESGANHIAADVVEMFSDICTRTQGLVSQKDDFVLVLSPRDNARLTTINTYGVSCIDIIKSTIPHLSVCVLPQLNTANGEGRKIMLYTKAIDGNETGTFEFTERLTMGKIIQQPKSVLQACRAGTWGAIIKQPQVFSVMVVS